MPTMTLRPDCVENVYVVNSQTPKFGDILRRAGNKWEVIGVRAEEDGKKTVTLCPEKRSAKSLANLSQS